MSKFVAVLFFLMTAFASALAFILGPPLTGYVLMLAAVLAGFGATLWAIGIESEKISNRDARISFGERILRFLGRLICGVVLGLPLLGFGLLSAIPYGGGNKAFFFLFDCVLFGGIAWAFVGLFESGGRSQSDFASEAALVRSNAASSSRGECNSGSIEKTNVSVSESDEKTAVAPIGLMPPLGPVDIRQFIKVASKQRIQLANADRSAVSRFFKAIRYGQTDLVRELLSGTPLLILTQDAYGNTPLEAAVQENSVELQGFFNECLR